MCLPCFELCSPAYSSSAVPTIVPAIDVAYSATTLVSQFSRLLVLPASSDGMWYYVSAPLGKRPEYLHRRPLGLGVASGIWDATAGCFNSFDSGARDA